MSPLIEQFFALAMLVAVMGAVYAWLVRPQQLPQSASARGLVALLLLTLAGGFLGAFPWWLDDSRGFSWDLPPLASRMLAAAGWSFALAVVLVLRRPTPARVRLLLALLAVYLLPLAVVAPLFHAERFDPSASITFGFFSIVAVMTLSAVWYLWRQPLLLPAAPEDSAVPPAVERSWLALVAAVTGLWGFALFVTDSGPFPMLWVWPGDLLTSRLIAVMLLAITVGAIMSLRSASQARIMLAVTAMYGAGLALAALWNGLAGLPIKGSYLAAFGLIFLISSALLAMGRQERGATLQKA